MALLEFKVPCHYLFYINNCNDTYWSLPNEFLTVGDTLGSPWMRKDTVQTVLVQCGGWVSDPLNEEQMS